MATQSSQEDQGQSDISDGNNCTKGNLSNQPNQVGTSENDEITSRVGSYPVSSAKMKELKATVTSERKLLLGYKIQELIKTEKSYVNDLSDLIQVIGLDLQFRFH